MKKVLLCALLASFIAYLDGYEGRPPFRCDYKYYTVVGQRYPNFSLAVDTKEEEGFLKFHEMPTTFHEAQLRCHLEGSILASPMCAHVKGAMKTMMANHSGVNGVFTGIHSRFSKGDYVSIDGVPLSNIPHKWAEGEPNNENDEGGCIAMLKDGNFTEFNCEHTLPYMCFRNVTPGMVMNACGTNDDEYILSEKTGSCYKLHKYPRTWNRAYKTCAAEGGNLAIINSEEEAEVIKHLYHNFVNPDQVGEYEKNTAHIGFHDWGEHGEWKTIHGQTLEEAGYNKFASGKPDNVSAQFCGGILRNGHLDDFWCDRRANFFCEKNPIALAECVRKAGGKPADSKTIPDSSDQSTDEDADANSDEQHDDEEVQE